MAARFLTGTSTPVPELVVQFPHVPRNGCEGILVCIRPTDKSPLHVILVDGYQEQLQYVEHLLSEQPNSRLDWVITHYHYDHVGDAESIRSSSLFSSLRTVYRPYFVASIDPHSNGLIRRLKDTLNSWKTTGRERRRAQCHVVDCGPLDARRVVDRAELGVVACGSSSEDLIKGNENNRSVMLLGFSRQWKEVMPLFSFLFPGDASVGAWEHFRDLLAEPTNDYHDYLPVALYKLAHHGAVTENRLKNLRLVLGNDISRRSQQKVVRIRNSTHNVHKMNVVEDWLTTKFDNVSLIDTRSLGENLWIHLELAQPLKITGPTEPDWPTWLPLPPT